MTNQNDSLFPDPEQLRAQVAQQVADAEEHARKMSELTETLQALEVWAESNNGEVKLRIDSTSSLRDLELDDAALDHSPAELARMILQTYESAQRELGLKIVEATQAQAGDDLASQVRQEFESRIGPLSGDDDDDRDDRGHGIPGLTRY